MTQDIINALLIAGLPVFAITFIFFAWGYKKQLIVPESESEKDSESDKQHKRTDRFVLDKWSAFGGGFYGTMAFIAFVHIEFFEIIEFFSEFSTDSIDSNLIVFVFNLFLQFIIESFTNFIKAIIWFTYWPNHLPINNGFVWLVVSYAAYIAGEYLARQKYALQKMKS
jgi:hypothetical protein